MFDFGFDFGVLREDRSEIQAFSSSCDQRGKFSGP
jgi:hypothetical protein